MVLVVALVGWGNAGAQATRPPTFVAHEIATGLRGGYQTIAADLKARYRVGEWRDDGIGLHATRNGGDAVVVDDPIAVSEHDEQRR